MPHLPKCTWRTFSTITVTCICLGTHHILPLSVFLTLCCIIQCLVQQMVKSKLVSELVICHFFHAIPLWFPLGAITQLGGGTIFRFYHPNKAAQLREQHQVQTIPKTTRDKPCCVLILSCYFCKADGASFRKVPATTAFSAGNFVKASQHHALCSHNYQL